MTDDQNTDLDERIAEAAKALKMKIEPGNYAVPRAVVWWIVEDLEGVIRELRKLRRAQVEKDLERLRPTGFLAQEHP